MQSTIVEAVLRRADYRCAWCELDMRRPPELHGAVVCHLGVNESDDMMVASCIECRIRFDRWWNYSVTYSVESAKRILGVDPYFGFSPFGEYLERRTKDFFAFSRALARIEAQRNAPLDLRRRVA